MGIWKSVAGTIRVEIISAEPERVLEIISCTGIQIFDVSFQKPLTVTITIYRNQYLPARKILQKNGCSVKIIGRQGVYWSVTQLLRRPLLCCGLTLFIFLWIYLPTGVLFIRVNGCSEVTANLILEEVDTCGLTLGMERKNVRSEKIKNALLERIPQLQWIGINTRGCVATISASEKKIEIPKVDPYGVSHIIAIRDGVIDSCTVTSGDLRCRIGEAVVKGQLLVSGYTDCGITILANRATAEIYGHTRRSQETVMLTCGIYRGELLDTKVCYQLIMGNRQINLYQVFGDNLALSDYSCEKTVEDYILTLPGGFQTPVILRKETYHYYETEEREWNTELQRTQISKLAEQYTSSCMIGGSILQKEEVYEDEEGCINLSAVYLCREIIGKEVNVNTLP